MMEWISVTKKLPRENVPCLFFGTLDGEEKVFAGMRESDGWYCFPIDWCSCCRCPEETVSHWMEYPKKPES